MKATQTDDDVLVLRLPESLVGCWIAPLLLLGCFVLSVVRFFVYKDPLHTEQFQGAVAGTLFFLIWCAFAMEFSKFTLDRRTRLVTWKRWYGFTPRTGSISFDAVTSVIVQTSSGDGSVAYQRLALVTMAGTVPLSVMYSLTLIRETKYALLASRIQAFIGNATSDCVMASVRQAIRDGNTIQAIQVLRAHKQMSLAEARQVINGLQTGITGKDDSA